MSAAFSGKWPGRQPGRLWVVACLCIVSYVMMFAASAAATARQSFALKTSVGEIRIESFGNCAEAVCPAVLILSGSKGFDAPVYDEIGATLKAAGLNAYLVHVLSPADLAAINQAGNARARMAYYARRRPAWVQAVGEVASFLATQPGHARKIGILGVSLGAQTALSFIGAGNEDIRALVLVDGGLPHGSSIPARALPPLLLIWGGEDRVFPTGMARDLQREVQRAGGSAELEIYEGGGHDFFLRSGTAQVGSAHVKAADFLARHLVPTTRAP